MPSIVRIRQHRLETRPARLMPGWVAAALSLWVAVPAWGNDSVGHLAAGGLIFGRTDAVSMKTEDLYVSTKQVRVRYTFLNRTDKDVTTIVAFPLPETGAPSDVNNFVVPNPAAPANFMDFQTKVDGRAVEMTVEQKAFAVGIDRTKELVELGLPVSPLGEDVSKRLGALPEATLERLETQGMVGFDIYDVGQGMQRHVRPLWTVRTIFYWTQTFRAGRDVVVEHSYVPSVGGAAQTFVGASFATKDMVQEYNQRFCMTNGFVSAARRLQKAASGSDRVILTEQRLEYILTTGANCAGAIGKFRLTVDKGAPENLVSFCMDGVRKVSPTEFVVEKQDFYPNRNLEVLILRPMKMP